MFLRCGIGSILDRTNPSLGLPFEYSPTSAPMIWPTSVLTSRKMPWRPAFCPDNRGQRWSRPAGTNHAQQFLRATDGETLPSPRGASALNAEERGVGSGDAERKGVRPCPWPKLPYPTGEAASSEER